MTRPATSAVSPTSCACTRSSSRAASAPRAGAATASPAPAAGRRARVLEVALLDRLRPLEQLLDLRLAGDLVHGADDLHVAELARLGNDQELEPVEAVRVVAEVVLHHLLGFLLGLARLLLDRGLLAVELARELLAALLRLSRLVAHALEQALDLLVLHEASDLRGRALSGLCE